MNSMELSHFFSKMNFIKSNVFLIFLIIHYSQALRCRSGNQQTAEEIRKVMQTCKRRENDNKSNDDNNSSINYSNESDEDDSADDGSLFERDFFSGSKKDDNNTNHYNNNNDNNKSRYMGNRASTRNYRSQYNRGDTETHSHYGNNMNNSSGNRNMRNRDSRYGTQYNNNSGNSNYDEQQTCVVQCFFDELNLVDRRGYPERNAVTAMMIRGIHNPTLRDFIEESIFECFHFLLSTMNTDKCVFSHNLLNCLADKGRETCEDWSD